MATIYYEITNGVAPFTVSINPAVASDQYPPSTGEYYFTDIPNDNYTITITDAVGCETSFEVNVNCTTTTTTTLTPTTTTTTTLGLDLKTDLISVWEMDETVGTTAEDSYASNDLTINGATINQSGKINKAYSYDGSSDYCYGGSNIVTSFPVSVSFWIKVSTSGINRIHTNYAANYYGIQIGFDYNQLVIQFGDGAGTGEANRSTYLLANSTTDGTWYHVVVVATAHNTFTYYVDTIEKTLNYLSGFGASTSFGGGVFQVGGPTFSPVGLIDQVAVWNKALSTDEISALYNSGNGLAYTSW